MKNTTPSKDKFIRRSDLTTKFLIGLGLFGVVVVVGSFGSMFMVLLLSFDPQDDIFAYITSLAMVSIAPVAFFFLMRKPIKKLLKARKVQRSVLEIGNDGYAEFIRKEKVDTTDYGIFALFSAYKALTEGPYYEMTYSYTDENGEKHERSPPFIFSEKETLALESLRAIPIKFIGGISEIAVTKRSLEEIKLKLKEEAIQGERM